MSEEGNAKNDTTKCKASNSDGDPTKRKAGKAWFFKRTDNNLKIYLSVTEAPLSNRRKKNLEILLKFTVTVKKKIKK